MIYAVATDSFMSGWGNAQGRSLVAIACQTNEDLDFALDKLYRREEMKRVRINLNLPRVGPGDALDVWTRETHPAWFPAS